MMQATENMHHMTFGQYDQYIGMMRTRVPLNGEVLLPTQLALIKMMVIIIICITRHDHFKEVARLTHLSV